MTAEVYKLHQSMTDPCSRKEIDRNYVLELEQENLDLRNLIAQHELGRWRFSRPLAEIVLSATSVALFAFVIGIALSPSGAAAPTAVDKKVCSLDVSQI